MRNVTAIAGTALLLAAVSLTHAQEPEPNVILGTDAGEIVPGTPGSDSLYGRGGDDLLLGMGGDDELDGGAGADSLSGGPGRDSVSYEGAQVVVTLDGVANDGGSGETDNVLLDTEDVYGTEAADKITGNTLENTLDGNGGDDQINGGPGADGLFGGEGDDRITSRDGSPDRVECGPGNDYVLYDARDTLVDCEAGGRVPTTENFQLARVFTSGRRATRLRLANIVSGSRVTIACVRGCRPRRPASRIVLRRSSLRSRGGGRFVTIKIKRSPLVAGATFEIGVKARRARPRCRRFRLRSRRGVIAGLSTPTTRCTSIARRG